MTDHDRAHFCHYKMMLHANSYGWKASTNQKPSKVSTAPQTTRYIKWFCTISSISASPSMNPQPSGGIRAAVKASLVIIHAKRRQSYLVVQVLGPRRFACNSMGCTRLSGHVSGGRQLMHPFRGVCLTTTACLERNLIVLHVWHSTSVTTTGDTSLIFLEQLRSGCAWLG